MEVLEHMDRVLRQSLGKENTDLLTVQRELTAVYLTDSQIERAIELFGHVVNVAGSTLSEEHPDRSASEHEPARAYLTDGQMERAIELLEHVVTVEAKLLSEEHPDRLASEHDYRGTQSLLGRCGCQNAKRVNSSDHGFQLGAVRIE